jgi:anti-sigma regulatory factor (Ser/Thr protein kinase)
MHITGETRDQPTGNEGRCSEPAARDMVERQLPADLTAPSLARTFVTDVLQQWGHDRLIDDGQIIMSELATNAVQHAGEDQQTIVVSIELNHGSLWLGVWDSSTDEPQIFEPNYELDCHRGLWIVQATATSWDFTWERGGKIVYAELSIAA